MSMIVTMLGSFESPKIRNFFDEPSPDARTVAADPGIRQRAPFLLERNKFGKTFSKIKLVWSNLHLYTRHRYQKNLSRSKEI
jgi:hypothetical protein